LRALILRPFWLIAVVLSLVSCRSDVEVFEAEDRQPRELGQMTWSLGDDRSPSWSLHGDTVYYTAEGFDQLSGDPGVLMAIPSAGGEARLLLPNVQSSGVRFDHWLVAPTPTAEDDRLAFVEILSLWPGHPCSVSLTVLACVPTRTAAESEQPPLREIAIRVRRFDATGPLEDDVTIEVDVPGVAYFPDSIIESFVKTFPFQQLFAGERAFTFRASWAPDGQRMVMSDGQQLLIWVVGEASFDTVPNTEDGAWPAWSPDGQWIALSRLERVDSIGVSCDYISPLGIRCRQFRTEYVPGRHVLSLVRPDGSGLTDLGDGDEPAWSPDGSRLFFRRDGRIWSSEPDGLNAVAIDNTEGGREPAVSPDGGLLAFSKRSRFGDYDIWVISLEP